MLQRALSHNMSEVLIYTDGGARNNPGPAGAGAVIIEGGKTVAELKRFLGSQTNNWAEYEAVAMALTEAHARGLSKHPTTVRLDSMLVCEQLKGNWKVKEPTLKPQHQKVRAMIVEYFPDITFTHIPREENEEADRLVNEAIDEAGF